MFKRADFCDSMNRPITQSLFLELGYRDSSIYTLKDEDFTHKGKNYPSIKKLYLEIGDPTEYEFAEQCFINWAHWQRICENKAVLAYIQGWRDELEVKIRSVAVKQAMAHAASGSYPAAKWISDRGWKTRGAGRPSAEEVQRETKIAARVADVYSADVLRMVK